MKPNPDKCHLLLSIQEAANIQIANKTIKSSKFKNLLGIILEEYLSNWKQETKFICKTDNGVT